MTTLLINGQRVKVGPEFLSLSPDEQNAAVDHIAKSLGGPEKSDANQGRATRAQRERLEAPISRTESFAEGAKQSVTFNTSDEIAGLKAAGTPEVLRQQPNVRMGLIGSALAAAGGGARMLAEKVAPSYFGSSGNQAYDQKVAQERAVIDEAREANPGSFLLGEVSGGLIIPAPGAAAIAQARAAGNVAAAIKAGAAGGAAIGAGYGFGGGFTPEQRLQQAAGGAAVGGLIGGVAVPAVSGVQAAGGAIANAAQGITSRIRGVANPEAEAARRVQAAFAKDAQAGNVMSGQQLAAAVDNAQPVIGADLGGETTRALMRSAANTSPAGREKVSAAIADRYEGQAERLGDFMRTFGPSDTVAAREALQARARASNRPAYKKAYDDGAGGVWNGTLADLAQAPLVQQAMRDAVTLAKNRAPIDGFRPPPTPFVEGADGVMRMKEGVTPTVQFWDHVQRSLRTAAEGGNREAGALRKALNAELDAAVPAFSEARSGAARFFGAEDALDAGAKFATAGKMNLGEAISAMKKMGPDDLDLFRQGFLAEMTTKIGKLSDGRDVTKAIMQSPDARNRVLAVLGPKGTEKLEAFIETEKLMNATRNALGNSTTARQLVEMGMGGGAGYAYGGDTQSAAMGALLSRGLRFGADKIDGRVSQKVAELLSSGKPEDWAKIIDLASKNKQVMQSIRDASTYVTRLAAPQGSEVQLPAMLGSPRAAADQEQRPK